MSDKRVGTDVLVCPAERASAAFRGRPRLIVQIIVAIAREIFDESAYARFLSRSEIRSCPEAYAAFQRECEAMKARRPKCC
jgi:hypothetical protein